MGVIQIALLWTLIGVLILIAIGGFLYIRSRQYISILDEEFKSVNSFNIDTFNKRLNKAEFRDKRGISTKSIEKLKQDAIRFGKSDYKIYEKVYKEKRKELAKWWVTPFKRLTEKDSKHIPESVKKDIKWRPFLVNKIIVENFERFTLQNRSEITWMFFKLSMLNQENESKDLMVDRIKEAYGKYKILYRTSDYQQLKDHPVLRATSKEIEGHIKLLEDNLDEKSLLQLKAPVSKILDEVIDFEYLVVFLEDGYRQLNDLISKRWINIKKMIRYNEQILENVIEDFDYKFKQVSKDATALEKALNAADAKKVEKLVAKIDATLFLMENEILKNIEAFALYKYRRPLVKEMVEELNRKKDQLIKEIERHDLDKDGSQKQLIKASANDINLRYKTLKSEEKLVFRYTTPWKLLLKQWDVIKSYGEHLKNINDTVTNIKSILEATDDASRIIAQLNIEILNSEYRLKLLPKSIQDKSEYKLNKYQRKVNQLISKYTGKEISLSKEQLKEVQNFQKEVTTYWEDINTAVFLTEYIREAILLLSKYQHINKVKRELPRLKDLYNEGQLKIALEEIYPLLNKVKKKNERNYIHKIFRINS